MTATVGPAALHTGRDQIPAGSGPAIPPMAVRARGTFVYDEGGRDYLDASSGAICVNLGHGLPEVLAAMVEQASRITFAHRSQFATRPVAELTGEVLAVAGPAFREVVYTNSGSEATETALRLALHHHALRGDTGRSAVLTQYPSYHGMTAGALGASGHPPRRERLDALHHRSAGAEQVRSADPRRLLPGAQEWERAFATVGPDRIAAVIIEPVGGAAGGAAEVDDAVLRRLRELCDASGALLVIDEVLTGFGRTGAWFGHQQSRVRPDLLVTGKGLSAGYTPIGACLVGRQVLAGRSATELAFGHTMSGNPLSAATALAVLRYTREHALPERARVAGAVLRERLSAVAGRFAFLGEPRGRGLLLGLPVIQNPAAYRQAPLAKRICAAGIDCGLNLYPAGVDHRSQTVLVAPPLTIADQEIDELVKRLVAALSDGRTVPDPATTIAKKG